MTWRTCSSVVHLHVRRLMLKARLWLATHTTRLTMWLLPENAIIAWKDGKLSTGYVEQPAEALEGDLYPPGPMPKQPTHFGPSTWQ